MPETLDVFTTAKTLAEHSLQAIHETWVKFLEWDNQKQGVSPKVLFFSPSLILICFTFISHCFSYSASFSFLILGVVSIHAFLKLTSNPISTSLHYQFLYSCVLSIIVLCYSPALPSSQAKTLLAVLFPIYYHTLTSSVSITLLISFPIFLCLLCSSLHEPLSNTTLLAALIVIPTIFWTKAREEQHKYEQQKFSSHYQEQQQQKSEKIDLNAEKQTKNAQEAAIFSIPAEKRQKSPDKSPSDTNTEEHEKVILGISHDCRNLLNSLKAILTLMKDEPTADETQSSQDDNFQSAIAITEHLTLLLTSLLDYLQKKENSINTQEEMKLTTTLEKIWLMIAPNLKRKSLGGSITIKNGTPPSVCLNESKFMGILLNLIGNSMKFTDTGHIKINVYWREALSDTQNQSFGSQDAKANLPIPGEVLKKPNFSPGKVDDIGQTDLGRLDSSKTTFYDVKDIDSISFTKKCFTAMSERGNQNGRPAFGVLVVTVRDTGCGIDEQSLKKLFKKYGQVGADKEKSKLGLGLGLWYTKYLLGKLNGKIDIRSSKDVGTWVKIEIPCKIMPQKREIKQMVGPEIPMQPQRARQSHNPCVYIRDNDRLASLLISEYLKKHLSRGAQVFEMKSILDILRSEKLRTGIYIIVVDTASATRQEIQGLKMLNRMHPDEKVPIVLLSDLEDVARGFVNNNDWSGLETEFHIKKPIRQAQLDQIVRNIETIVSRGLLKDAIIRPQDEVAHVLIVDDESTSVLFLQRFLAKSRILSLVARDGHEAVSIYKNKWADIKLILMDSEMPRMNGLEATRAIRRMGKDIDLKIIGLTGNDTEDFREIALETGMNEVLVKPVPAEKLLQIVNRALDMRQ